VTSRFALDGRDVTFIKAIDVDKASGGSWSNEILAVEQLMKRLNDQGHD